jgi:hypothetical protein
LYKEGTSYEKRLEILIEHVPPNNILKIRLAGVAAVGIVAIAGSSIAFSGLAGALIWAPYA